MPKKMTHVGTLTGATMHTVELRQAKNGWVSNNGIVYNKFTGWPPGVNPPFRLNIQSVRRIKRKKHENSRRGNILQ